MRQRTAPAWPQGQSIAALQLPAPANRQTLSLPSAHEPARMPPAHKCKRRVPPEPLPPPTPAPRPLHLAQGLAGPGSPALARHRSKFAKPTTTPCLIYPHYKGASVHKEHRRRNQTRERKAGLTALPVDFWVQMATTQLAGGSGVGGLPLILLSTPRGCTGK